jgi:hypothetical protein
MPKLDYEMPEIPMEGEEEEMDLFAEESKEPSGELGGFSDEELIEELRVRGFEVDEESGESVEEMPEEMPEEEDIV